MSNKTYYFEDHFGVSEKKPVRGFVTGHVNGNEVFNGENLVVNSGRLYMMNHMRNKLTVFWGEGDTQTTSNSEFDNNVVTVNPADVTVEQSTESLYIEYKLDIAPIANESKSIKELGTYFKNENDNNKNTLFSRITFSSIPLTTDNVTFTYRLYF